jgi:Trypsin.
LDGNLKKEYLPPQERDVAAIKIHPDFSTKTLENNIALLKLSSNIDYDDHIRPICLADWNVEYDSDNCIVTGWGRDSAGNIINKCRFFVFILSQLWCSLQH